MTWPVRSAYLRHLVLAVVALALIAFLVARAVVFASLAQFSVDSTADARDASVGDGVCRTVAGACTLRAAIQEANARPGADEIQLPGGTYTLGIAGQNQNDATSGDLDITDSVTITGSGAGTTIVDGNALDRVFEVAVAGGTVALSGLTITDGDADEYGGALLNSSSATVTVDSSTVTGSRLSDNRAGGGRSGAAISNDGAGAVVVETTTFSKNRAHANGGAIFNGSGQVSLSDSTFTDNAATHGGAVYSSADKGGLLSIRDSTFALNSADDWGGAVVNQNQGSATIRNVSFSENSGLNGGGFANEGNGLVTVENSTFTKNAAELTALLDSGEGGGMHSNSGGEVVVSGGSFTDNTARSGGGLSNEGGGSVAITGTRFATNTAREQGGGILIQSGAVRMLNIDVVNNVAHGAEEGGGGISYAGDKAVGVGETAALEQSRIRDNKATGPGGGIDSRGDGPLAITTTSITGNTASTGGAVYHVGDAPLEVTRSTLSGNFAENGGGVFSDGDGEAHVVNTTISGNRAGQFGGGVLVSSRVHMLNSTVASNTAASGGGINNGGGDLIGDGSVFLRNTIVAGSPTGGNCAGTMTSLGGNLDSANTCRFAELTDQPGTDPRVVPLAANGGAPRRHPPPAG